MSLDLFQLLPAVYRMRDAQIASAQHLLTRLSRPSWRSFRPCPSHCLPISRPSSTNCWHSPHADRCSPC